MRRPILLSLSLIACGAIALSACGKEGAQSGSTDAEEYQAGPLDEYMSQLWSGEEWSEEKAKAEELQREELVAQCMQKEGFEYNPSTGNTFYSSSEDVEGPAWDSLEFAETYGYGIIDWPGRAEQEATMNAEQEEWVDPNADYVNSLSPSEQEAYYEVLHGPPMTQEEMDIANEEQTWEYNWETAGCYGWAQHEIGQDPGSSAWEDSEFEDLVEQINSMWETINTDSEMVALNREWLACMTTAGYTGITSKDESQQALYDVHNSLYWSEEREESLEPTQDQLDAFQEKEIAQAVADWKCTSEIKYNESVIKINHRVQQEFLDEHKAELDAWISKYGTNKG